MHGGTYSVGAALKTWTPKHADCRGSEPWHEPCSIAGAKRSAKSQPVGTGTASPTWNMVKGLPLGLTIMENRQDVQAISSRAPEVTPIRLALCLPEEVLTNLPSGADHAIHRFSDSFVLTRREKEVVTLICCGYKNEAIAQVLKLSPPTVRFHMRNIHKKTGTSDKLDVVIRIWADTQQPCKE